jgi:hypothetical protein
MNTLFDVLHFIQAENYRVIPLSRTSNDEYQHLRTIQHVPRDKSTSLDVSPKMLQPTFPSLKYTISQNAHHSITLISRSYYNNCHRSSVVEVKPSNKTSWPVSLICSMVIDMACTLRILLASTTIGACYNSLSPSEYAKLKEPGRIWINSLSLRA